MSGAFSAAPALGADRFRTLDERMADPMVAIEFRPGVCDSARIECFGGPQGPLPLDVVRSALRNLRLRPEAVVGDPDPGASDRTYLTAKDGERLARIVGLTPDQVNDGLIAVYFSKWDPHRNREAWKGSDAVAVQRFMPTGDRAGPQTQSSLL